MFGSRLFCFLLNKNSILQHAPMKELRIARLILALPIADITFIKNT